MALLQHLTTVAQRTRPGLLQGREVWVPYFSSMVSESGGVASQSAGVCGTRPFAKSAKGRGTLTVLMMPARSKPVPPALPLPLQRLRVTLARCRWHVLGSKKAIHLNNGECPVVDETCAVSIFAVTRHLDVVADIKKDRVGDTHLLISTGQAASTVLAGRACAVQGIVAKAPPSLVSTYSINDAERKYHDEVSASLLIK